MQKMLTVVPNSEKEPKYSKLIDNVFGLITLILLILFILFLFDKFPYSISKQKLIEMDSRIKILEEKIKGK